MKIHRHLPVIAACVSTALALSACGDSDAPEGGSPAKQPVQTAEAAKPAEQPAARQSNDRYKGCALNQQTGNPAYQKMVLVICVDVETSGAVATKLSGSYGELGTKCTDWVKPTVKYGSSKPAFNLRMSNGLPAAPDYWTLNIGWLDTYAGPQSLSGQQAFDALRMNSGFRVKSGSEVLDFGMYDTSGTGLAPDAVTALDIKPDGSGSITWKGLNHRSAGPDGVLNKVSLIDAKATWRCIDPAP